MEKNNQDTNLKIVHNSQESNTETKQPLSHNELLNEISKKGTIVEREQVVIENLKRRGLI